MSLTLKESAEVHKKAVLERAKTTASPLDDPKIKKEVLEIAKSDYGIEQTQEIIKQTSKGVTFNVLSLKDLHNYECPSYTWRVQNLIQDKKTIIVAGSSAVGKSWLMINLGLSVAKGVPFLDNFQVEKGGVLFIDRENSIPELQNRVEMVSNGMNISLEEDLPLFFISEQSLRLDDISGRDFLKQYILENNIKLIIVDTYRRVISYEENDANAVSFFFTECLKPICEQTGASFVFIHHHKKGKSENDEKEMLRGSSDLVNFVDGVIQISRKGSKLTIKQTKNRSGKEVEPFDLNIETDEQEYFRFKYLGKKQDTSILGKVIEVLMVWFAEQHKEHFETAEARELCASKGIKKQRFFEGIEELVKRGFIEKVGHGKYKIISKQPDLEIVHSPLYKSGGLSDFQSPEKSVKSVKSKRTIRTIGLLEGEDSDRDTQYWADSVTTDIQPCSKQEVLDYVNSKPEYTLPELLGKFGPGVMALKWEGLI